LNDVDLLKRRS